MPTRKCWFYSSNLPDTTARYTINSAAVFWFKKKTADRPYKTVENEQRWIANGWLQEETGCLISRQVTNPRAHTHFKAYDCISAYKDFNIMHIYTYTYTYIAVVQNKPFLPRDALCIVQSAVLRSHVVCPSVRPSVTLVICDHIGWKSWKLIARSISPAPSLFVAKRRST